MKTKSPFKEMLASTIILAGAGPNRLVVESRACQTDNGYKSSSSRCPLASFSNQDVYDSKDLVVNEIPESTPQVIFSETDGSMSAINSTANESQATSNNDTYFPASIRYSDDAYIRLRVPLHLTLSPNTDTMRVEEWNMDFPARDINNIDKHLVKHFEDLYRKTRDNRLSDDEKKTWGKIVDSMDWASFSQEVSLPQFEIGQITSLNKNLVVVCWLEGVRERFRERIPFFFTSGRVAKGDWFEAMIKRGRHGVVVSIKDPKIIDPPAEYDLYSLKTFSFANEA